MNIMQYISSNMRYSINSQKESFCSPELSILNSKYGIRVVGSSSATAFTLIESCGVIALSHELALMPVHMSMYVV